MNATPATDQPYTLTSRPVADPAALVGRWVRLSQDRAEYVGVLARAVRTARSGGWEWTLRTPLEEVTGTGRPAVEPLAGPAATARGARRRLRAVGADLAEFAPAGDTAMSRARDLAEADLDQLEWELAARP
jgi:hypothetical protein